MRLPPLREMVDELVATPSVSAVVPDRDMPNRPIIDRLAQWMSGAGYRVEIMPLDDRRKANVIATRGPMGMAGLVLSGHTDTVPFDEGKWDSDPFRVTERDGKLFGLGTADMKSFLAVALTAAARFDDSALQAPLTIVGTANEECGMDGARALLAAQQPQARRVVIGEPTGLRPIRMQKGISMERLVITGRSGHSSDPALGASALEGMRIALAVMDEWRAALQQTYRRDDFRPPVPTLNLGNIHGGDNPNRICARCELQYDLRTLPGMPAADVLRAELRERIERALDGRHLTLAMEAIHEGIPPFETLADRDLVQYAETLTGTPSGAVAFGTEAPFFGALGAETIVLGPGDIDVAHQPNEFVREAQLHEAVELVAKLIGRYCVGTP